MGPHDGGESERLAPVTPLFGDRDRRPSAVPTATGWHPTWQNDPSEKPVAEAQPVAEAEPEAEAEPKAERAGGPVRVGGSMTAVRRRGPVFREDPDPGDDIETGSRTDRGAVGRAAPTVDPGAMAEKALLRKLRSRSLSVQEARSVLREHTTDADTVDAIIDRMADLGYLDDEALAEQLVHSGLERRGQGRQVISQTLAKRGVPRDVADAALATLPDDDLERALDFARRKAATVGGKDPQAALRRLVGQLSRRGYPSGVAMTAARQALDELRS
jgi:regulatory protein